MAEIAELKKEILALRREIKATATTAEKERTKAQNTKVKDMAEIIRGKRGIEHKGSEPVKRKR